MRSWLSRAFGVRAWVLIVMITTVQVASLFNRSVEGDHVAYALPAANLVATGRLATPQVGSQFSLDKEWRFNAPLLGAGPTPFFVAFGIGQWQYLLGCLLGMTVAVVVFVVLVRRATELPWLPVILIVASILLTRIYLSELYNQRYTVIAFAAVALLYFPSLTAEQAPFWKWGLAGILPLLHPALLVGSVVWTLSEVAVVVRTRNISWSGTILFGIGVSTCAVWYLQPAPLVEQFLPHLRSRSFVSFSGWEQPASRLVALLSQSVMGLVVIAIVLWIASLNRIAPGGGRVALLLVTALALDVFGRMFYLPYFVLGVAPASLRLLTGTITKRWIVGGLAVLGVLNLIVAIRLDLRKLPDLPPSQQELDDFVRQQTQAGDILILGPPFTFQAVTPWPDRTAPYVVPMPLYLNEFDQAEYLALLQNGTVYVGDPEYFTAVQKHFRASSPPIFADCEVTTTVFRGRPVWIARQVKR